MKQSDTSLQRLITSIWKADGVEATDRLTFEAIALAAESGELLNQFKKHRFYRNNNRRDELLDELSDVYYHVSAYCAALGMSLPGLEKRTIEKHRRSLLRLQKEQTEHSFGRNLSSDGEAKR